MPKPIVLLLDDDADNVEILEEALAAKGYDVRMARSCAEARALLATTPADALVTDLALGDGDAFELVNALGSHRPRVAVLVTGYGSAEDRARSGAAGFDAHLVKPFALDELDVALRRALQRVEAQKPATS